MNEDVTFNVTATCSLPLTQHDTVQMAHGSGGRMMHDLIKRLFVSAFDNSALRPLDDQAIIECPTGRLAFSTDSYIVDPIFFPGGDIGELAVYGTVNDICMCGARPLYLSAGFIIEEGFPLGDLERVVRSMRSAAVRAGVQIVTGDTKVVNRGKVDKLFINTAGVGTIAHDFNIGADRIKPGDVVLLSGAIASHGMAILSQREGLSFESPIVSDTAPLNELVADLIDAVGGSVHALRDPTRGGLAAVLNEFAASSSVAITIRETDIPIDPAVAGACELLGIDPLHVANEGKLVAVVAPDAAPAALEAMRRNALGTGSALIGETTDRQPGLVSIRTRLGGERIVDLPVGEQLPRIC